ncbi:MAG: redoxin domain-containing protein [Bacteroidota bacterium]
MRFVLAFALLALPALASAQDALAPGAAMPLAGESFDTADGGSSSLGAIADEGGLVVVFWSAACPWTTRYEARLGAIVETARANGIGVALVASNDPGRSAGDTPEALAESAATVGAPLLMDPSARLADAFGASQTPQAYLFGDGLLYSGAVDDSPGDAARVTIAYLQQAVEQHLAGQAVEIEVTTPFGCTIKRAR